MAAFGLQTSIYLSWPQQTGLKCLLHKALSHLRQDNNTRWLSLYYRVKVAPAEGIPIVVSHGSAAVATDGYGGVNAAVATEGSGGASQGGLG